jgi:hypothetical protein
MIRLRDDRYIASCRAILVGACAVTGAGMPVAQAGDAAILVADYYTDSILSLWLDGRSEVIYTAEVGLNGPFGSNALLRDSEGRLLVGNFNDRRIIRVSDGAVIADESDGIDSPDGLTRPASDEIFVANRAGRNILRIGVDGDVSVFDSGIGDPMSIISNGYDLFVATDRGQIYRYEDLDPSSRSLLGSFGPGGNVALACRPDGTRIYYLDDGVLTAIDLRDPYEASLITEDLGNADEGLLIVNRGGEYGLVAFASDFAGTIYRVEIDSGESSVFADRDRGLTGPSALLWQPANQDCDDFLVCDSNCDGYVDFNDIDAFVVALVDRYEYFERYPACHFVCNNDVNRDGNVDFRDIDGFVECLTK